MHEKASSGQAGRLGQCAAHPHQSFISFVRVDQFLHLACMDRQRMGTGLDNPSRIFSENRFA